MVKALQIELLKSKRTKSFAIASAILGFGFLWTILVSKEKLTEVAFYFCNQDIYTFVLPLAISIFASRIVSNEKEGRTFKLQASNGRGVSGIFHDKLYFSTLFFMGLAVIFTGLLGIYISLFKWQTVSLQLLLLQVLRLSLSSFVQICLYISIAMYYEKQGLVLSMGFIGSFVGMIFQARTDQWWAFLLPWEGTGFLAPYKFSYNSVTSTAVYTLDNQLLLKIGIYILYATLVYALARGAIQGRKGMMI